MLIVSRITKGKHAQFQPDPSSFDTCDHFSSFRAFHKFSRRNKFESIRTFVHSFRLYLRPGIYRGKTFLLALLIRSAERQMLNPYSLEWKIFTEAFSLAENIRLFEELVVEELVVEAFDIYARRISLLVCTSKAPEAWEIETPRLGERMRNLLPGSRR